MTPSPYDDFKKRQEESNAKMFQSNLEQIEANKKKEEAIGVHGLNKRMDHLISSSDATSSFNKKIQIIILIVAVLTLVVCVIGYWDQIVKLFRAL